MGDDVLTILIMILIMLVCVVIGAKVTPRVVRWHDRRRMQRCLAGAHQVWAEYQASLAARPKEPRP